MIEMVFFSIFVIKQAPQEMLVQILDVVNGFINNPLFAEYGRAGLFINGVFSMLIPFPPEVTAISLVLAGISRIEILVILVTSWIIGAALGYYAGLYGKKLAVIFKVRRKEREKLEKRKLMIIIIRHYQDMTIKFITTLLTTVVITKRRMRASRADTVNYLKDIDGQ
jgi:membrane protein YqaA with SNARE-associated domain